MVGGDPGGVEAGSPRLAHQDLPGAGVFLCVSQVDL